MTKTLLLILLVCSTCILLLFIYQLSRQARFWRCAFAAASDEAIMTLKLHEELMGNLIRDGTIDESDVYPDFFTLEQIKRHFGDDSELLSSRQRFSKIILDAGMKADTMKISWVQPSDKFDFYLDFRGKYEPKY